MLAAPRYILVLLAAFGLLTCRAANAGEVIIPSDLSVHLSAEPTSVQPGQPVVLTLTIVNHGPETVADVALISADFYDQIDLGFGEVDCSGFVLSVADGQSFHFNYWWFPMVFDGPLAVGEARTCHITRAITPQMPPVWPFSFGLLQTTYYDLDPSNNTATVVLRRGDLAPTTLPSHSPLALLLLALGLSALALTRMQRMLT